MIVWGQYIKKFIPKTGAECRLDDVFVTVTEFMDEKGNFAYQGIVNVDITIKNV